MPLKASSPRILIVRVGAMGDILHALPAVTALRQAMPAAHLGWAIEPRWRALLDPSLIDQVHEVPTRDWKEQPLSLRTLRQILTLRREFQAARYDVAVDLQGSVRSAFLARLSGAARVVGQAAPRETPAGVFYTRRISLRQPGVIGQAAELLNAATGLRLEPVLPVLPNQPADIPPGFLLLAPTAGWGAKQWPIAAYNELIQRLETLGHTVLVNSADPRDPILRDTRALAVHPSIAGLIALTRRAALVVGGDTGPVHLAAALGRPTLALFGPTDPARNGPNFPDAQVRVLRHPDSRTDHRRHAATEAGLARLTVDEVYDAAVKLLEQA